MRLGYKLGYLRVRLHDSRFNEAEAHAPRIHPLNVKLNFAALRRFNEAEAHAPRIPTIIKTV